jgi:hypothetical protein
MEKLLFEEARSKGAEYRKEALAVKIAVASFAVIFTALLVMCLIIREYLVAIIPGVCILFAVLTFVFSIFQEMQSLQIYADKISYRKTIAFKTKEIALAPSQYTLEIAPTIPFMGYSVKFTFKNAKGEKVLTYRAVSLHPSAFGEKRNRWEKDIFAIGCEVNDKKEMIKNK